MKRGTPRSVLRAACAVALLLGSALASPAADDAAARERLRSERAAIEARFEQRERDCSAGAAATACVESTRRARREALVPVRREEAEFAAARRRLRADERAAAREARLAAVPRPAPAPRPVRAAAPVSKLERAAREARSLQAYEERQRSAQAHRDAVAERQAKRAQRAGPAASSAPLPLPLTAPDVTR